MIKIKFIASSSAGNCCVLDNGKTKFMLDCGVPWKKALQGIDFDLSSLVGCFLSHEHGDHAAGVKSAILAAIDMYCSPGTAHVLKLTGRKVHQVVPLTHIGVGAGWSIFPLPVEHDAAEPLGVVVRCGDDSVLFLTDTSYCHYRISHVTHLIVECNFADEILDRRVAEGKTGVELAARIRKSHLSLRKVKDLIKANSWPGLKEVYLTHLSDSHSNEGQFKEEIQKITGCPVYVADK